MSFSIEMALTYNDDVVESVLDICYNAVDAAAARAGKEKTHRQGLQDRYGLERTAVCRRTVFPIVATSFLDTLLQS